MSSNVFRKAALERLSSPEQLDRLVTVTSPKAWIALVMLVLMVAAAVIWGIFGRIPTRIDGQGILISSGGRVVSVQSTGAGSLAEILVTVGDPVAAGQIVARLTQTDAEQRLVNARAVLLERQAALLRAETLAAQETAIKQENFERRRRALGDRLQAGQQRLSFLEGRLRDEEQLLRDRILTREIVARTRDDYNRAAQEVAEVRNTIAQQEAEELDLLGTLENRVRTAEDAVAEAERQITQISVSLDRARTVLAPESGVVTEIKVTSGQVVQEGQSLFTFQSGGAALELVLYVPPQQGKRITPGMAAQISPSTARREEFGTLHGTVASISDFPATLDGMRALLQNDELARTFSQGGSPYVARITLIPDADTISGYRWSSSKGAALALSAGTLASAEITVAEQAPITMVVPLLREFTGLF